MSRIEFMTLRPKELDTANIPSGWKLLQESETQMVRSVLAGFTQKETWKPYYESHEGRNLFFRRHEKPADPMYSHIQLSGGYYSGLTIEQSGVGTVGQSLSHATAENFVPGHESMYDTVWIDEDGSVKSKLTSYAPTGAYTEVQAAIKTYNTMSIKQGLIQYATDNPGEPVPFSVPLVLGVYTFSDETDPDGKPIAGIGMLSPSPEARFDKILGRFIRTQGKRRPDKIRVAMDNELFETFFVMGGAMQKLHDEFGAYHRQLTGGNCGVVRNNEGIYVPFIADWQTMKQLPENKRANDLARALDVATFWESLARFAQHHMDQNKIDRVSGSYLPTMALCATCAGYLEIPQKDFNGFQDEFWTMTKNTALGDDPLPVIADFLSAHRKTD